MVIVDDRKYRKKSNSSYKKLTELEKKQTSMLSMINRLKNKAKVLGDLRFITNEIVSNCAYHNKNIEEQFSKFDKLKVPQEELEILTKAWELKYKLGQSLLTDLKDLITYVETNYN